MRHRSLGHISGSYRRNGRAFLPKNWRQATDSIRKFRCTPLRRCPENDRKRCPLPPGERTASAHKRFPRADSGHTRSCLPRPASGSREGGRQICSPPFCCRRRETFCRNETQATDGIPAPFSSDSVTRRSSGFSFSRVTSLANSSNCTSTESMQRFSLVPISCRLARETVMPSCISEQ